MSSSGLLCVPLLKSCSHCVSAVFVWFFFLVGGAGLSGTGVFLHLHRVLAPSCVCDGTIPHCVAPVRLLAGWCAHGGLVHPQPVSNRCIHFSFDSFTFYPPSVLVYEFFSESSLLEMQKRPFVLMPHFYISYISVPSTTVPHYCTVR